MKESPNEERTTAAHTTQRDRQSLSGTIDASFYRFFSIQEIKSAQEMLLSRKIDSGSLDTSNS